MRGEIRGLTMLIGRAARSLTRRVQRARSLAALVAADVRGRLIRVSLPSQKGIPAAYPVYFTCAADFEYLRLSIRSLTAHAGGHVGRIHVYQDRSHPLTAAQKSAVTCDTALPIVWRTTRAPMSWGGVTLLHNELRAFVDLSRELGPEDVIVKVDSDVLFTAGWLFPTMLASGADLAGQPVASMSTHTSRRVPDVQGGCYFLRVGALPRLRSVSLVAAAREVARTSRYGLWRVPEDRTISQWAHDAGVGIRLTDFYLLDLGPLRSSSLPSDADVARCLEQRGDFALIHFEGCKDKMAPCFRWLSRRAPDAAQRHLVT
jgi:hypothetical protein